MTNIKKIVLIFVFILLALFMLGYTLLFTKVGNSLLRPIIEAKINQTSPIPISLSRFVLDSDSFNITVQLDKDNAVLADGKYSIFKQTFNANYQIDLTNLSILNKLAKRSLSGKLLTNGNIKGDLNLFKIKGKSNFADSNTDYAFIIKSMELNKIGIKIQNLNIEKTLLIAGEKPYLNGKLDLKVQLNDLNSNSSKGTVALDVKDAKLSRKLLQKEFKIDISKTDLDAEVKAKLNSGKIDYAFNLNSALAVISSSGVAELNNESINSNYLINIKELAFLKSITKTPLRGPLSTEGTIVGNKNLLSLKGTSNIASSQTSYDIKLKELKPSKVIVKIKKAKLNKLLYMLSQDRFADATIDADILFNDLSVKNMDGKASIRVSNGRINNKLMAKKFKVTLPKTTFTVKADAFLQPDRVKYTLALNSNLAKINSKGMLKPEELLIKANYGINISKLELLKPFTNAPLRGAFQTSGDINGDKNKLNIIGKSNVANSKTVYKLLLEEFKPSELTLNIKGAKLSKLLYLVGQPSYADAKIELKTKLTSITPLNGNANLNVSKGIINTKTLKRLFKIKVPNTQFDLLSNIDIKENKIIADTDLKSNLATLKAEKSIFNIDKGSFNTKYKLNIPSLIKLEPILDKKLYGKIEAEGEMKKDKDLLITAHSKIFSGKVNLKMLNNNLNVDFGNIHAIKILKMLKYPQIIDSTLEGKLTYNKLNKIGKVEASFENALLQRSKMTDLIGVFSKIDLTKERFNNGKLISNIDKNIIKSKLVMQSKKVHFMSKKFIIDSKKESIDARFALKIDKQPADIIVSGKLKSPKVKLDAKSVLTPVIKNKIKKELNRFLKRLF